MKQRISVEQYKELSELAKRKLEIWCEEKRYGAEIDGDFIPAVQLSIGEMIEFLDEEYGSWYMESWQDWHIISTQNNKDLLLAKENELVDALWKATSEILERSN